MAANSKNKQAGRVVRILCLASGALLCLWALSDHPSIGGGTGFGLFQGIVLFGGLLTMAAGLLPTGIASAYLVMFVTAMISLGLAELVLQSLMRDQYYTAYEYDEDMLFRLRPGARRAYTHQPENGGQTVRYRVNEDGFVGPELTSPRPGTRIMVYGDSFIHAEYSAYEERFTTRLQGELSSVLAENVEVINAGIAGFGPDQILRRMEAELDVYKPDLAVISIFSGNDFGDLLRNRMYGLDAEGRLVDREFALSAEQARQVQINRHELALVRALKRVLSGLRGGAAEDAVAGFDAEVWIEMALDQHRREYETYAAGDPTVGTFAVDPYSTDIAAFPEAASSRTKIELMDAIIGRMSELAAAAEVELLFMIIPHPMDLLDGDHAAGRIDKAKYPGYSPVALTGTLEAIVKKHGERVINLYPAFRAEDVNSLYLKGGDDHWNGAGQALAAGIVAADAADVLH